MLTPTRLAIGLTVFGFVLVDLLCSVLIYEADDWICWNLFVVGIYVGQINLIATWGAIGPGNVVVRLPWSILLGLFMWYAMAFSFRIAAYGTWWFRDGDIWQLGGVLLSAILVAQVPLWIAGRSFRWRLINAKDASSDATGLRHLQFQIRHMLLGTAFVALALGVGRVALPPLDIRHMDHELVAILLAMTVTNLVVAVPCIWGALVRSNPVPPLLWPIYCALITAVEFGALCAVLGSPGSDWHEYLLGFFAMNLSQCATVYFILRIFRALGFRLVRKNPVG